MRYNNKFFATKEAAQAFKKAHGGDLYSMAVAQDTRAETVNPEKTPYCVAWNEF